MTKVKLFCIIAISDKSLDNVRFFLQQGADVKIRNRGIIPHYMMPISCGNNRIFDAILEYGGNINERATTGKSTFCTGVYITKIRRVQFLLLRGADVNAMEHGLFEDCLQIILIINSDNTKLLQQLFKWGYWVWL